MNVNKTTSLQDFKLQANSLLDIKLFLIQKNEA